MGQTPSAHCGESPKPFFNHVCPMANPSSRQKSSHRNMDSSNSQLCPGRISSSGRDCSRSDRINAGPSPLELQDPNSSKNSGRLSVQTHDGVFIMTARHSTLKPETCHIVLIQVHRLQTVRDS
ncbi:g11077 [Coccomyxa viridis]|uniref:G11077 protein n=1 Tax=Coccomyxa viridis TaxID=1274662 RepID=A0ABP1G743_9CHLO